MLETIGLVVGGGILAATFKIAYEMGFIKRGLNGLCKTVDRHTKQIDELRDK